MENHHISRNVYKLPYLTLKTAFPILPLLLFVLTFSGLLHTTYAAAAGPITIYLPIVLSSNPTAVTPTPGATPGPTATNTPVIGFGSATGRILWNDQPITSVTVKLCTDWRMLGGCQTQAYTAVSGNDGRYTITDIPAGDYEFATKLSGQVETGWLGIKVTVVAGQTVTIRDVTIVKYDLNLISPINHATVTTTTPTLTWEGYPGAASYRVNVVNRVSFDYVVNNQMVSTPQFTIANPLVAGEYYWYIYADNAAGKKIAENASNYYFVVAP